MGSRISKMIELEKEIFGKSLLEIEINKNSKDAINFVNQIDYLDTKYFNTMSTAFFSDKVAEEIGEAKEALVQFKKTPDESAKHLLLGEISDFILATASAMEHDVIIRNLDSFKEAIAYIIVSGFHNKDSVIQRDILITHYNKIKEIYWSVVQYNNIINGDRSSLMGKIQTSLRDDNEINDPSNKLKIVKEIRRMYIALTSVGALNI